MENIFALDIGTRSVTGIIMEKSQDKLRIIDFYNVEHHKRSMRDGQIHDILAVADVIQNVKETLEKRTEVKLHKVCVAAAGRALKTTQASASINLREISIHTVEDVKHLELTAVQVAQEQLASEREKDSYSNYYCVGYSVLHYKLDQEIIGSLIDQKGNEASAEIIATFLPKVVVESLLAAISRAGLEMEAMTLEPIAALHVLVPESMRRLNVTLVDIGAGTSDIAIADKGTVAAYGMVPVAGDEITEAISDFYLLDFPMAESFKRKIVNDEEAEAEDILGFPITVKLQTLVHELNDTFDHVANKIADEILLLNNKQPRAVMLIGGGSLTPEIRKKIANKLDLPENRVAVRGVDSIKDVENIDKLPTGPEFITPVGIAITAKERPVQYIQVKVNDRPYKLFNWNTLNVGDCLVQAGYEINRMYGKPGAAMMITVNNKKTTIPGSFGSAPIIQVNNKEATVDDYIKSDDNITIDSGIDGRSAELTLEELVGKSVKKNVHYNNKIYPAGIIYLVNNKIQSASHQIKDGDNIIWKNIDKVKDFINYYKLIDKLNPFYVFVNNQKITLSDSKNMVYVNNKEARLNQRLSDNDNIHIKPASVPTVLDLYESLGNDYIKQINITFNQEIVTLRKPATLKRNEEILTEQTALNNHDKLEVSEPISQAFIFQDVFAYVDLDLSNATGQFLVLRNGEKSSFDAEIFGGDQLEIKWD